MRCAGWPPASRATKTREPPTPGTEPTFSRSFSTTLLRSGDEFLDVVAKRETVDNGGVLFADAFEVRTDLHFEVGPLELERQLGDGIGEAIAERLTKIIGQW